MNYAKAKAGFQECDGHMMARIDCSWHHIRWDIAYFMDLFNETRYWLIFIVQPLDSVESCLILR
ncbi:hypothetical protein M514_00104 [Trichuris suis]|nr:hypothetical protein M514_00104 [Trichuris suis]